MPESHEEIVELRAEVAALRAELRRSPAERPSVIRRGLIVGLAGAGAAAVAGVANAEPAAAADVSVLLGQTNTTGDTTRITHTDTTPDEPGLMVASAGGTAI